MRSYRAEGIILKRSNFGEADRIITVFTKSSGKIKIIAKGVRKITSRKSGHLELFNQVQLQLSSGKSLDSVSEVSLINAFSFWRRDLKRVGVAYYFCELVDKLTAQNQEHEQVFLLLVDSLKQLRQESLTSLIISFERNLLKNLGFGVPKELETSKKSLKNYIEEITEKKINSPKIIREIW